MVDIVRSIETYKGFSWAGNPRYVMTFSISSSFIVVSASCTGFLCICVWWYEEIDRGRGRESERVCVVRGLGPAELACGNLSCF